MTDQPDPEEPHVVPLSDELDLHSFLPRDVVSVVDEYVQQACAAGLTRVRIVHTAGDAASRGEWCRRRWNGTRRCGRSGTILTRT